MKRGAMLNIPTTVHPLETNLNTNDFDYSNITRMKRVAW